MARASKKKPKGWHPADIRAAVVKRGKTLTGLALENDLDESACRAALIRPLPKAEKAISRLLDVPLHVLWPDRWDEEGRRYRHVREGFYHDRDVPQRQNREAA
jgi:Ner family transcriptional regulator